MEISTVYPFDKDVPDIRDLTSTRPFSTFNSNDIRRRSVYAVVAMGLDRAIGADGDMPWHLREDLRHFKSLTMGHPVIMGRATWESLPKRPLPGRLNIVVTRNPHYDAPGAVVASSVGEAVAACPGDTVPFIIGGGAIYKAALPLVDRLFVTLVDERFPKADTFFPDLPADVWRKTADSGLLKSDSGLGYSFIEFTRV